MIAVIMTVAGIAVFAAGLYNLAREFSDPGSRKVYGVISLIGLAVALMAGWPFIA